MMLSHWVAVGLVGDERNTRVLSETMDKVCAEFDVKRNDVLSKKRHQPIVIARIAFSAYIRANYKEISFNKIGLFINRDHASVVHHVHKHYQYMTDGIYPEYKRRFENL